MSELTDDQLDGLFRKSAEEPDPLYDEAAWQDMKARLDRHDRMAPVGSLVWRNRFRWGLLVLLLLFITASSWYAYTTIKSTAMKPDATIDSPKKPVRNPLAKSHQQAEATGLTQKESTRPSSVDLSNNTVNSENKLTTTGSSVSETELVAKRSKPLINVEKAAKASRPVATIATKLNGSEYRLKSARNRPVRSRLGLVSAKTKLSESVLPYANRRRGNQSRVALKPVKKASDYETVVFSTPSSTISAFGKRQRQKTLNPKSQSVGTIDSARRGKSVPEETVVTERDNLIINELKSKTARWPNVFTGIGRSVVGHPDTTDRARSIVPSIEVQKGFSIRLAVAPDLSTIGLKNFTRPGTNVGLLLEYRLTKRWSVQAGVIQSTKVYKAGSDDYVVPEGMWSTPGSNKPETVDGSCNMLDIPLNVRYDLVLQPRTNGRLPSRWFMSGGLTTYVMNKEDYHYTYSSYTHGQKNDWSTSTGSYGFSNLNMSVGYERALGKRLFWQVEPFIKLPLKGVGAYKINLLSTGSFFSLRYKL